MSKCICNTVCKKQLSFNIMLITFEKKYEKISPKNYIFVNKILRITWIWWFLFRWIFRNRRNNPNLYPRQNTSYTVSGFKRYIVHCNFKNWSNRWTLINYITFLNKFKRIQYKFQKISVSSLKIMYKVFIV